MRKKLTILIVFGIFSLIQPTSAQTWEMTKRLTYSSGDSWSPALAVDSSNHLHVVWHDYTPGNWEIYYRKGIQ